MYELRELFHSSNHDMHYIAHYASLHVPIDTFFQEGLNFYSEDEIWHYASKYYDPVKAHEYYMRTRELKGRQSTRDLNDEGKEIWKVAKSNIKEERSQQLEAARAAHKIKMEAHRSKAKASRKVISDRLKEVLARISDQRSFELKSESKRTAEAVKQESKKTSKELEKEKEKVDRKIELEKARLDKKKQQIELELEALVKTDLSQLPEGPLKEKKKEDRAKEIQRLQGDKQKIAIEYKNVSKTIRKKSSEKQSKIREDASNKKEDIREKSAESKDSIRDVAKKASTGERETASQKREALSAELKSTLDAARAAYDQVKESIRSGAQQNFSDEFEKIKAQYGKSESSEGSSYTPVNRSAAERKAIRRKLAKQRK